MISDVRSLGLGIAVVFTFLVISAQSAAASSMDTLYAFCSITKCRDGTNPTGIGSDSSGNLFGVAVAGGNAAHRGGYGTVYELKDGKTFNLLYRFCSGGGACLDGSHPMGPLVVDVSGNLYGVTVEGGAKSSGTIFELVHRRHEWRFRKLYDFCSQAQCTDGSYPFATLTYAGAASGQFYDGVSPLYGVTSRGGNGNGVAYQFAHKRKSGWAETVLYTFCTQGGTNCTDGSAPNSSLLVDAKGNLFGTTTAGGANHPAGLVTNGAGVVFELALAGSSWTESVLYNFCAQSNCGDGAIPSGPLIQDASGVLLGATEEGGNACPLPGSLGCGTLYKLASDESGWHEAVLYSFCGESDCADGVYPEASLLLDTSGNLFGVTYYGGTNGSDHQFGSGVLFEIGGATFKVLHSFCALDACADGSSPYSAMIMNGSGELVGVASSGGLHGAGVVFDFKTAR